MFKATVYVRMKEGLLDPQGKAIEGALRSLGFSTVEEVKVGKLIEIKLTDGKREELKNKIDDMCRKLLANPVIETFKYDIEEQAK